MNFPQFCLVIILILQFQKEPNCLFAHIDGEANYDVIIKEKVGVYPTFKFYSVDNKDGEMYLPGKFEERWSEKNITKYMSIHCKSKVAEQHVMDKLVGGHIKVFMWQNFNT